MLFYFLLLVFSSSLSLLFRQADALSGTIHQLQQLPVADQRLVYHSEQLGPSVPALVIEDISAFQRKLQHVSAQLLLIQHFERQYASSSPSAPLPPVISAWPRLPSGRAIGLPDRAAGVNILIGTSLAADNEFRGGLVSVEILRDQLLACGLAEDALHFCLSCDVDAAPVVEYVCRVCLQLQLQCLFAPNRITVSRAFGVLPHVSLQLSDGRSLQTVARSHSRLSQSSADSVDEHGYKVALKSAWSLLQSLLDSIEQASEKERRRAIQVQSAACSEALSGVESPSSPSSPSAQVVSTYTRTSPTQRSLIPSSTALLQYGEDGAERFRLLVAQSILEADQRLLLPEWLIQRFKVGILLQF